MISDHSKHNIELAFQKAARATLVRDASDICEIVPTEIRKAGLPYGGKLVLITTSSFLFRLMTIFRLVESPATRTYFNSRATEQKLEDVFAEFANLCCGAFNRELTPSFPHLAMSIPETLSNHCIEFLRELNPQYLSSYLITINDSVRLHATLCLSCSVPVEVADSTADTEPEHNVGELELF
jgi:hypothetical protein